MCVFKAPRTQGAGPLPTTFYYTFYSCTDDLGTPFTNYICTVVCGSWDTRSCLSARNT